MRHQPAAVFSSIADHLVRTNSRDQSRANVRQRESFAAEGAPAPPQRRPSACARFVFGSRPPYQLANPTVLGLAGDIRRSSEGAPMATTAVGMAADAAEILAAIAAVEAAFAAVCSVSVSTATRVDFG